MTARMASCLVGRGESVWEALEDRRGLTLLSRDDGGETEGGCPFDLGGGVLNVS